MSPLLVLDQRKHCSRRIDVYGGRPTWRPIFGTLLTKIHTGNLILLTQKIKPSIEMCCYTNIVSWIGVESKAISKMVIVSTELLSLECIVDSGFGQLR